MASSLYLLKFLYLLSFLSMFHHIAPRSFSSVHPLCHGHERSYLLQFKESFVINKSVSSDPSAYPKVASWTSEGNSSECCSWDGVECDEFNGHVIGLDLNSSYLYGSINSTSSLFNLVHLQRLNLADNCFNHSQIPSTVSNLSRLTHLNLAGSCFSSQIPLEFSQLSQMSSLDLSYNTFKGDIPSSFGNLTHLNILDLFGNNFEGHIPSSLGNLMHLNYLDLALNSFNGDIPSSIGNLTQLTTLFLYGNNISGQIPFGLMNLTKLSNLNLEENHLVGQIPSSISNLENLEFLDLSWNNFIGKMEFDLFVKLKKLTSVDLSHCGVSLIISDTSSDNTTLKKFHHLGFGRCNLGKFPNFLANQDELTWLGLQANNIHGQVPEWFWNVSKENLEYLDLSENFLTSLGQQPILLPWTNLVLLTLNSNKLQGSLPIPSFSTLEYRVSSNSFTGKIPELICNMSFLQILDLSGNYLSGSLPQCLHNFGDSLHILNLQRNAFGESIPQAWTGGSKLKMINFSQNKFQGWLPRSLAKCRMLEALDFSNNQFNDTFPTWLGNLPNLRLLILRSNKFYGPIKTYKAKYEFPSLQILDLSYNSFTGSLPLKFFQYSNSSRLESVDHLTYIQETLHFVSRENSNLNSYLSFLFDFAMMMTNKGVVTDYMKVPELFTALDFSSNRFFGDIPESIGNLNIKGLRLLNLSNNFFTGHIPQSLKNFVNLESLDLSQNKLFGEIPQELTQLTFLEYFNVFHNHLVGPIPQGKQFNTFPSNSFEGNPGLCGSPLTKKCKNYEVSLPLPSSPEESQHLRSTFQFSWKIVLIGYGFGLVVGVTVGHAVSARSQDWLMKTFGIRELVRVLIS